MKHKQATVPRSKIEQLKEQHSLKLPPSGRLIAILVAIAAAIAFIPDYEAGLDRLLQLLEKTGRNWRGALVLLSFLGAVFYPILRSTLARLLDRNVVKAVDEAFKEGCLEGFRDGERAGREEGFANGKAVSAKAEYEKGVTDARPAEAVALIERIREFQTSMRKLGMATLATEMIKKLEKHPVSWQAFLQRALPTEGNSDLWKELARATITTSYLDGLASTREGITDD